MSEEDPSRARNLASARRLRAVFALLAVVVPIALFALFLRQERRLYGLADHGAVAVAKVTRLTRQGSSEYAEYAYEVNGVSYSWSVARADAPLPPGESFPVTYLPEAPSLSRPVVPYDRAHLDAELNLPIRRGVPLGALAFFGGMALYAHVLARRLRQPGTPRKRRPMSPGTAGRMVAALLLTAMLAVELDPKVRAVQGGLLGAAPLGLPVGVVSAAIMAVLFVPFFWVLPHLMRIVMSAQAEGRAFSKIGVLVAVLNAPPDHRRSRAIVLAGLAYFVALVAGWIALAASRGL